MRKPGISPRGGPDVASRYDGFLRAVLSCEENAQHAELRVLMDALTVPVFAKDAHGRFTFGNSSFLDMLGYDWDDVKCRTVEDIAPDDLVAVNHHQDVALAKDGGVQIYEKQVKTASGELRDFVFNKTAIWDDDDTPLGIVGVMLDVSEKNALRETLALKTIDLDERMKEQRCHYALSSLLFTVDGDQTALLQDAINIVPSGFQFPDLAEAHLVLADHDVRTPGFRPTPWAIRVEIVSARTGEELGYLEVVYTDHLPEMGKNPFLKEEIALLEALARVIARFLVSRDNAKRLAETDKRCRATFEQAAVGISHVSPDGRFLRLNDWVCRFWGYSREELLQMTFQEITVDADLQEDLDNAAGLLSGKLSDYRMEKRYRRKDGDIVWARLTVSLVYDAAGAPDYFISVVEDISAEHKSAEDLWMLSSKLSDAVKGITDVLLKTQEKRDPYTAGHERRVSELALAIGRVFELNPERLRTLEMGALIHDIGKLTIPASLLTKPGRLSDEEFALIKTHPKSGFDVVDDTALPDIVADIALHHHERWDGSGYPHGLVGEEISLEARIVALADCFEAVVSHRPYRPALGAEVALDIVQKGSGASFDPKVVQAFDTVLAEREIDWIALD